MPRLRGWGKRNKAISIGFRHHAGDWLLNPKILKQASDAIDDAKTVDRTHDVAYGAGYAVDGKTLYLDHSVPLVVKEQGYNIPIAHGWLYHEACEKALLMFIKGLPYQFAHQVAYNGEKSLMRAYKIPWELYDRVSKRLLAAIYARPKYPNCPPNLDLTPYMDELDHQTLVKMFADGKPLR